MSKRKYKVAILTASDSCAAEKRGDESGAVIRQMLDGTDYAVADYAVLPDDEEKLAARMIAWADDGETDLILTTGGTGLSPRDRMPEATLRIADQNVPGIAEAVRAHSMGITRRAMFSRAVSAIRGQTLIVNMPGSPKAVRESLEFLLPELGHALDVLGGGVQDCARK